MAFFAGVGETTISPPVGAPLLGPIQPSAGIHDDLFARSLVLSDGSAMAAIVCLDLVGLDLSLAEEIRLAVQRRRPEIEAVLLLCSHTHSAPLTIPWSVQGWQWLSGDGQPWRESLVGAVANTAAAAAGALRPAALSAGRAPVRVGTNRRLPGLEGVRMLPNPGGVCVAWTDVLRVDECGGAPIALLFSHAAHPVIVHGASTLVSADYPGYAVAAARERLGGQVVAMFAQGCGGNINGDPLRGGFEAAEAAGRALGEAAVLAACGSRAIPPGRLRISMVARQLPLRDLPPVEECERTVRDAEARLADVETRGEGPQTLWYLHDTVLCCQDLLGKARRGVPQTLPFAATAVSIEGEWALVAMTHEVFADYQLWLDEQSPFRSTMAAAYANGCESYIPTDAELVLGGYEAASFPATGAALRYPYRVALRPGAEEQVKAALSELLEMAASG